MALIWLSPTWFYALIPLAIFAAVMVLRLRRQGQQWKKVVATRLESQLVSRGGRYRHIVACCLLWVSLILFIIALARPISGYDEIESATEGRNIVFVIDTSRSMRVPDPSPSRLESARALCFELLPSLDGDQISVVAFANEAFTLAPLTSDRSIIAATLTQMSHQSIPEGGSNLAEAVDHALDMLEDTQQLGGAIILMSDGEDHDSAVDRAASRARKLGIPIMSIGIGSREGGLIPDPRQRGGFFLDARGQQVLSTLKTDSLDRLATESQGLFISGAKVRNARSMILSSLDALERIELESRVARLPRHLYFYFLMPALLLLLAGILTRVQWSSLRSLGKKAALICCLAPFLSDTSFAEGDLERLKEEARQSDARRLGSDAISALVGRHGTSDLAALEFVRGSELYESGDFVEAAGAFSAALLTDDPELETAARYNLGNALARAGESQIDGNGGLSEEVRKLWEDAIGQYEEALQIDPQHEGSQANIEALKKAIEQLTPPEEEQEEKQDKSDKSESGDESEESDEKEKSEQEQDANEQKKSEEEKGDESEEEKQDKGDETKEEKSEEGSEKEESSKDKGEKSEEEPEKGGDKEDANKEEKEGTPEDDPKSAQPEGEASEGDPMQAQPEPVQPGDARQFADLFRPEEPSDPEQAKALQILRDAADLAEPPRKRATKSPNRKKNW